MLDPKIQTLLTVAECGSFVAASRRLSITQPAVSHHIRLLEEALGARIFDRGGGKITLTAEGVEVIQCARKITALYENLREDLRSRGAVTHLAVGLTHTAESGAIALALARYCVENGRVNIKMVTHAKDRLYAMLKNYELDVAVVEGRVDPGLQSFPLDTDRLILAVPADHPLAGRESASLEEIKKERMLLRLPNSGTRNLFLANLESSGMSIRDFHVVLELDNVNTIKELIRGGFGVSILPESVCVDELRRGEIAALPVENLTMTREINIACQKDFVHREILRDIVKAYRETVENGPGLRPGRG